MGFRKSRRREKVLSAFVRWRWKPPEDEFLDVGCRVEVRADRSEEGFASEVEFFDFNQ